MGPSRWYPNDPWHPNAVSTANLCRLALGPGTDKAALEQHFELIDLNTHWHSIEGQGDVIAANEAKMTVQRLISNGALVSRRKTFTLGAQVTNFIFSSLRTSECRLSIDAWTMLQKCTQMRLRSDDDDARFGFLRGPYDFIVTPVWHPRILLNAKACAPPGWRQNMMNVIRLAASLPPKTFK